MMGQRHDNTDRVDLVAVRPIGVGGLTVQCESAVVGGLTSLTTKNCPRMNATTKQMDGATALVLAQMTEAEVAKQADRAERRKGLVDGVERGAEGADSARELMELDGDSWLTQTGQTGLFPGKRARIQAA